MRSSRNGQSTASSAAILVALIGLVLIGYILALPPQDREALLQGGSGGYNDGRYTGGYGNTAGPLLILAESPGTLQLVSSPVIEHNLPSTTVFTSVNTVAIKELSSLYLKNSLFSRHGAEFRFNSTGMAERFLLSFNVDDAKGNLIITLNGNEIFNQRVTERSPQPIILPRDYLRDGENEIIFLASGVGFKFWSRNEYQLRNILISADAIDLRGSYSEQQFAMPEQEYSRLDYAQFSFIPECDPRAAGRLIVEINGVLIYSGYPDCGVLNRVDVSKDILSTGSNRVVFVSEEGSYLLDRLTVMSFLEEQSYPVYYFNLPIEIFETLDFGNAQLLLTMRFADYRAEKRGEIIINGFVESFQADEFVYQAALDPNIIVPGPNTIQVVPHVNRLDVAELKIEMI